MQVQQVVLNLVLNGLNAMLESALAVGHLSSGRPRRARPPSGSGAGFRVGIDEADWDRIFQAFYRTKSAGLGMGLAIARSIVDAHGGRLEAENNPDGGATFSFTLPVAPEGAR